MKKRYVIDWGLGDSNIWGCIKVDKKIALIKVPHWYAVQESDTTMLNIGIMLETKIILLFSAIVANLLIGDSYN